MLVGDERQHYSQTLDGIPVVQRADGSFCYARLDGDRLAPTNRLAHDPQFRTTDELNFISTQVASREDLHILRNQSLQRRAPRKEAPCVSAKPV